MRRVWSRGRREGWANDLYQAKVFRDSRPFVRLSIAPLDGSTRHQWAEFQQIKNEVLGPEWEAIELYPAESRLQDMANRYHLWCRPKGALAIGWYAERRVKANA